MSITDVSRAIRVELARADLAQKDVAEWLGYLPSQVAKRMAGDIEWRVTELQTIAKHLDVPVSRLIDDPMTDAAATA